MPERSVEDLVVYELASAFNCDGALDLHVQLMVSEALRYQVAANPREVVGPAWGARFTDFDRMPVSVDQLGVDIPDVLYVGLDQFIVRSAAKHRLAMRLGDQAVWQPCRMESGDEWYMLLPTLRLPAIDFERSQTEARVGGLYYCHKYAFLPDQLRGIHLFRAERIADHVFFVTQSFRDVVSDLGLTGFNFRELWRSSVPKPGVAAGESASSRRMQASMPVPDAPASISAGRATELSLDNLPEAVQELLSEQSRLLPDDDGEVLAKEIGLEIDTLRQAKGSQLEEGCLMLGLRLALLIERNLHWRIGWCRYEEIEGLAVVSRDNRYVLFPESVIHTQIKDPGTESNVLLLYNMLKANKLPPTQGVKPTVLS